MCDEAPQARVLTAVAPDSTPPDGHQRCAPGRFRDRDTRGEGVGDRFPQRFERILPAFLARKAFDFGAHTDVTLDELQDGRALLDERPLDDLHVEKVERFCPPEARDAYLRLAQEALWFPPVEQESGTRQVPATPQL